MEQWKDLGAPLAAVVVVLSVLLKAILDQGNGSGKRFWQTQDSDVMRQTYERVTRLEEKLAGMRETLDEVRKALRLMNESKETMEKLAAQHMMEQGERWREFERWKHWVEEELRKP